MCVWVAKWAGNEYPIEISVFMQHCVGVVSNQLAKKKTKKKHDTKKKTKTTKDDTKL